MNKCNSIETINKTKLTEQTKFRLNEISKIDEISNYFIEEIIQRKSCSKKLSVYVAAFSYIDKILIALSATSGGYQLFRLQVLLEHQLE